MTIRRMRIACWIPKATNTHTEYGLLRNSCRFRDNVEKCCRAGQGTDENTVMVIMEMMMIMIIIIIIIIII